MLFLGFTQCFGSFLIILRCGYLFWPYWPSNLSTAVFVLCQGDGRFAFYWGEGIFQWCYCKLGHQDTVNAPVKHPFWFISQSISLSVNQSINQPASLSVVTLSSYMLMSINFNNNLLTVSQTIKQSVDFFSFMKAMQCKEEGDFQRAIQLIGKDMVLQRDQPRHYVEKAEMFLELCDFQSAILNYKKACFLEPNNTEYYSRLAFIFYFQGQVFFDQRLYAEALESFSRASEMLPEKVGFHTRRYACGVNQPLMQLTYHWLSFSGGLLVFHYPSSWFYYKAITYVSHNFQLK